MVWNLTKPKKIMLSSLTDGFYTVITKKCSFTTCSLQGKVLIKIEHSYAYFDNILQGSVESLDSTRSFYLEE